MKASEPQAVAASFDRAAPTYLANAGVQAALARWLAEWLPAERAGRALEVGAGPGVFTRLLLPWTGPLTATDASPAMCAAGKAQLPQLDWRRMAAEEPEGGPWEWIFSSSMLQWAADPAAVFAAWRASLAPGGRVLGALFAAGSLPEWHALAGVAAPLPWRTAQEWGTLIERSGLRLRREQSARRVQVYPSALAFLRSLHGAGAAPARQMPPGRLRRLLRDYETRHAGPAGVSATWTFYRFEAAC
jgi:trans-aconitate methyltransferase